MNKQTKSKRKTILSWIHQNRIKIGIWLFLVILPITLILTAYVGSYTANRSVYFDSEITEESVKINDFVKADEIKGIDLNITWDALKRPTADENGILKNGYYRFILYYLPKNSYQIESVTITPVLQTDWKSYRSVGMQRNLTTDDLTVSLDFNFELPESPLLFVTINDPNLYLRVDYTYTVVGQEFNETEYVKFSLNDLNPNTVIPST
jgi:hypothetical protein